MYNAKKEVEKIDEKLLRLNEKYEETIETELKNGMNPQLIPKKLLYTELEYVYVTLRRNAEIKDVLEMFVKEPEASKFLRTILLRL